MTRIWSKSPAKKVLFQNPRWRPKFSLESIFELCHNYKKVSEHQNEQLWYSTVFCGTNGIEVTSILRSHAGPRTQKLALFGPGTSKISIFEKNAKP